MQKIFTDKSANFEEELENMDQIIYRLEHLVETLKAPNDIFGCIIVLLFSLNKVK